MFTEIGLQILTYGFTGFAGWASAILFIMMAYWPMARASGPGESFASHSEFCLLKMKDQVKRSTWTICFAAYLFIQIFVLVGAVFACLHLWSEEISKEQYNARISLFGFFVAGYLLSTLTPGYKFRPTAK